MPSLSVARATNAAFAAAYRPTALFVGGTSGVGEGTAGAFARATKGNAHILLCGRSKANAERIIATFPRTEQSQYEFIECDVSYMKNIVKASEDIKSRISTLNYLVLSPGILTTQGFNPTGDGIDFKMALHFYSRFKFVDELLPCLEDAVARGQEARVMTILSPGPGTPIDTEDLGIKKNFTLARAAKQAPAYNDYMVKEYAERHPNISFIHIFPGSVSTQGISKNLHWSLKAIVPLLRPLLTSIRNCGEWMASALISPNYHHGAFYLDHHADSFPDSKIDVSDDVARAKLVEHYKRETDVTGR